MNVLVAILSYVIMITANMYLRLLEYETVLNLDTDVT